VNRESLSTLLRPLLAITLGLLVGAIAIWATGHSVTEAYAALWKGAFGNKTYIGSTLARSGTIAMAALGVAVAFRAGALNLGGEGQLVLGGLVTALAALYLPVPTWLAIPAALLAGAVAGALWALLPAWLEAQFKVSLLIGSLLLNYVAVLAAGYLVSVPFRDRTGGGALAQTPTIPEAFQFAPLVTGTRLHIGLVITVVVAVAVWFLLMRTVTGYEWRMTGLNPGFADYGGVSRVKGLLTAMLTSGAIAGMGGAIEVMAIHHRYIDGNLTRPGFAWSGVMAALLAENHPIAALLTALLLGAIQIGSTGMERTTEIPLEISSVVQAVIVLFVSVRIGTDWWKRSRARSGPKPTSGSKPKAQATGEGGAA